MRLIDVVTQAAGVAGTIYRVLSGHWDLFDSDGKKLLEFDTFFSIDTMNDAQVTQAPVENGSFASYNKQVSPTRSTVVLGYTGSSATRAAILKKCQSLIAGTELVSVVTPDRTFVDMSLVSMDYTYRAENGIDRLVVALSMEEVRQVSAEYTTTDASKLGKQNVKNKADASTRDTGKQAGKTPRTSTLERARQGVASWL